MQRAIGGGSEFSRLSAVIVLHASKAGRHSLVAKLAIDGDTTATNDTAKRTFVVKPAPKPKKR